MLVGSNLKDVNNRNQALANPKEVDLSKSAGTRILDEIQAFLYTCFNKSFSGSPQQFLRLPNADTVVDIRDPNHPVNLGKIDPGTRGTRQSSATITFPPGVSARIQKIHILSDNREVVLETLTRKGNRFFFEGNSTTYSKDAIILLEMKDGKSYAARLDEVWK